MQIILDGLKLPGHGNQAMDTLRKKCILSGVNGEYNGLQKFAPESDSQLFGGGVRGSIKKKGRHYRLQALKQSA